MSSSSILSIAAICGVLALFSASTRSAEGEKQPDSGLTAKRQQAEQLAEEGKAKEAEAAFRQLVEEARKTLGTDHAFTLMSQMQLFRLIGDDVRLQETLEQLKGVLEVQEKVLGTKHPETLETRYNLIKWLGMNRKHADCEMECRTWLKSLDQHGGTSNQQMEVVISSHDGAKHPATELVIVSLAVALAAQQKHPEAAEVLQRVTKLGNAETQFRLAVMMAQGQTFKQDPVEAYKWAALAAAQEHAQAKQSMETLESILTPEQLAEGKKRVAEFQAKKPAQ